MHRFISIRFYLLPLLALLVFISGCFLRPKREPNKYLFSIFNTEGMLVIWERGNSGREKSDVAFQEILQQLQHLHNICNAYDPKSELSRLNQEAAQKPFACSDELWQVILAAEEGYKLTNGYFDTTIGPLMKLWGFHGARASLPTETEIQKALQTVGFHKLILDREKKTVAFPAPGFALDFGGILKGYACDKIKEHLEKRGFSIYLADLGGEVLLSQETPFKNKEAAFSVGLKNPDGNMDKMRIIDARGCAIATSGTYERKGTIGEKRIAHIINPKTGRPVPLENARESITVQSPRGVQADALATALFCDFKLSLPPDTLVYE